MARRIFHGSCRSLRRRTDGSWHVSIAPPESRSPIIDAAWEICHLNSKQIILKGLINTNIPMVTATWHQLHGPRLHGLPWSASSGYTHHRDRLVESIRDSITTTLDLVQHSDGLIHNGTSTSAPPLPPAHPLHLPSSTVSCTSTC